MVAPAFIQLVDLLLSLPASSADCERGFSLTQWRGGYLLAGGALAYFGAPPPPPPPPPAQPRKLRSYVYEYQICKYMRAHALTEQSVHVR